MPHRSATCLTLLALLVAPVATVFAQPPPVLPADTLLGRAVLKALDEELSGVAAKDHVARLAQWHRVPSAASRGPIKAEPGAIGASARTAEAGREYESCRADPA